MRQEMPPQHAESAKNPDRPDVRFNSDPLLLHFVEDDSQSE
jgi:hypothetical protein